jgi:hypothetical protein
MGLWSLALAWSWNFVMPLFWAGAPQITWLHALGVTVLLSAIGGIFNRTTTVVRK